jgi:hypothetical protein
MAPHAKTRLLVQSTQANSSVRNRNAVFIIKNQMHAWNLQILNWVDLQFQLVRGKNTLQSDKPLQLFSLLVGLMVNRRLALVFYDGKNTL